MDSNNGPAVRFDGIAKTYDGGASFAVDTLNMEIPGGTFVALVGESGSGKSTLLKMVNRLVEPSAGQVALDGAAIVAREVATLRRKIGYIFQNIGLFPHMSVAENIMIIPRLGQTGTGDKTAELLELVGLPIAMADRLPAELSGGQQQRVGVARALAGEPGLMLMDEPFGALDPVTRDQLGQAYRALHDRFGLTTIMVTHDMTEALLIADHILVMSAGRIVADGPPEALLADGAGEEASALIAVPKGQMAKLRALEERS